MAQPWRMFLYALALRLGKTVRQLLAETDSRELSEWQAYFMATAEGKPRILPAEEQERFFKSRLGGG